MMLDAVAVMDATSQLRVADFALDSHQRIYGAIQRLSVEGCGIDALTVGNELDEHGELKTVGGSAYLAWLSEGIPRNFNIESYVRIVKDQALKRRLHGICHDGAILAQDPSEDPHELADWISKALVEERPEQSVSARDAMPKALEYLDASESRIIPTGVPEIDVFTSGGMRTKELWIIGALPSRGKSSLARQFERGALRAGVPVHTHTVEMPKEDWLLLHAAVEGGVEVWKLRQPRQMTVVDRQYIRAGAAAVADWPLMLDDGGKVHIESVIAKSRLSVMRHGTKVVIVDFLQLLDGDEKEIRHRMATAAKRLKQFAKTHDCCVVALSQLARRGDINTLPTMQDLKESGDLEAAGDVVLLNYMPVEDGHFTHDDQIIVGKQRQGAIGSIPVRYDTASLTFKGR
jgi:replicative DNA helicase